MRTTSPPAQIPRISPISSECCDTSSGRLLSLQAAARGKAEAGDQCSAPSWPLPGPGTVPCLPHGRGGEGNSQNPPSWK